MNTSIIKFDYNGNVIPFEKGSDVMVNLTAMAKAYPGRAFYSERVFNGLYGITLLTCLLGL